MKIVKLSEIKEVSKKDIVVYPTDTIYGLGCSALDSKLVDKLRKLKKRCVKPFSVIVSKEWIKENCVINESVIDHLNKLPGRYTFILELKNKNAVASNVNDGSFFIGVRIPKHTITKYLPIPFITTSVNVSGETHVTNLDDIPKTIKDGVDMIIDAGFLDNNPSTVIDLTKKKPMILRD